MATSQLTTLLAWLSVGTFLAGVLVEVRSRRAGRPLTAGAWVVFGVFWGTLIPHFWYAQSSFIEAGLSAVAVPLCAYTGYRLYAGRDSLFVISRAVAVMGAIYLPATTLPVIAEPLVELVSLQAKWGVELLGYDPALIENEQGVRNTFLFTSGPPPARKTAVLLACTGLGSMAIFAGLIAAVEAPLDRKLQAFAVTIPVIWVLNIVRNVFIAAAFGAQWFQVFVPQVLAVFGKTQPQLVSYLIADKILSQSASLVALVAIMFALLRVLPELETVVADVLYLLTGETYELGLVDPPGPGGVRADGGEPAEDPTE